MAGTKAAATKKTARTPSPAKSPKVKSEKKPRAASTTGKKKKEEATTPAPVPMAVMDAPVSEKKPRERKKKETKPVEVDEEITSNESEGPAAIIFVDSDMKDMPMFKDSFKDERGVHNVIRVQYLQMYAVGLALIGSAFSPQIAVIPLFAGASELIRAIIGALCLAQAFSLTAVAQTTFTPMKKTLQYGMVFEMLFAFLVIVKRGDLDARLVQGVAASCLFNIALSMWVVYFRKNDIEDKDE